MKKTLIGIFFILAAASSALGQGRTVVSGTVTDANSVPYSGASLTVTLTTPTGTIGAYLNGVQINSVAGPVQLDPTGSFLIQLPDNTLVQCANAAGQIVACAPQTQWAFAVTLSPGVGQPLGTGAQTCNATITITGSSQSVSPQFSACPALTKLVNGTVGPGGGGGGGGGTPATQAGGSCLAPSVLPGTVCAGPVPTPTGAAPTLQTTFANTGFASTFNSYSISGAPLTSAASVALFVNSNSAGGSTTAPDGTWTLLDDVHTTLTWEIFSKSLTSTATLNLTNAIAGPASFNAALVFLGGSISSVPHTATSSTVTCPGPNDQCATLTVGPVSASNVLFLVGRFASGSTFVSQLATVSDTSGNVWQKIYSTITNGQSMGIWIAQTPAATTPTILVDGHENTTIIGGCCKVYELAGPVPYFSGSTGPASFRYLTQQDLIGAGIAPGVQSFTQTLLAANVTVTTTATTIATASLTMPGSGCPCRVFISYSLQLNYAGVTNEPDQDFWVSDGTTVMAGLVTGQSNASTGAVTSASFGGYSPTLYSNGQTITFTLLGIDSAVNAGTQTFLVVAAQPTGAGPHSSFQVSAVPSR